MQNLLTLSMFLVLFASSAFAGEIEGGRSSDYNFKVGVGKVNITPREEVTLAGSPSPKKTSSVDTPLFVKAMVISNGQQSVAIVTLDTLKYPTDLVVKVKKQIEDATQIPLAISLSLLHIRILARCGAITKTN